MITPGWGRARGVFLGLCAFLFCCFGATPQVSQFEGRRIVDIQFSPPTPLDPADLAKVQPLKKGELLRARDVSRAIDSLFATGVFDDIVAEAEPSGSGVIVRFVTQNVWFFGGLSVEGKVMTDPNRGQIVSTAQFSLGAPFHDEDLTRATQSIQHLLEANGLYEAKLTPSVERDNDAQQVFITFRVQPGKRAKYEAPVIEGETKLPENTILRATGWRLPSFIGGVR